MKIRMRSLVVLGLAALSGGVLLGVSQQVQKAEDRLEEVRSVVYRERENISVLEAEWVHLTSPPRLEELNAAYLGLVPPGADDIMPEGPAPEQALQSAVFVPGRKPVRSRGAL